MNKGGMIRKVLGRKAIVLAAVPMCEYMLPGKPMRITFRWKKGFRHVGLTVRYWHCWIAWLDAQPEDPEPEQT